MGDQTLPADVRQMRHNVLYVSPENASFYEWLKLLSF